MTSTVIITFCVLLLIAYFFDLTASKSRIPSVFLLLLLGWTLHRITDFLTFKVPNIAPALPILGTIGLILIVLEGSLELELHPTKLNLIKKSALGAFLPLIVLSTLYACALHFMKDYGFKASLTNSIPLAIISSAIAISSARNLTKENKAFITYESSLSDIFGVLAFNFIALNETIDVYSSLSFVLQLLIMTIISFLATLLLSLLLSRVEHHIKFVPIILLIILIYDVSKIYHLPALIFILIFGLFIGNLDELKQFKIVERLKPDSLNKEVTKFKDMVIEGTFLIRSLFFLVFGYLIKTEEVLNVETLPWAIGIVGVIFLVRIFQLKLSKLPLQPLLFIAPRGLITILLFLMVPQAQSLPLINNALMIQVILCTTLVMMIGLMTNSTKKQVENKQ